MGLLITKIGLSPILFAQGKFVRKTVPRLPEAEGSRNGIDGQGKTLRLLVLGDSAAAGVGVANQNEALLGKTVSQLKTQFEVHWKLIAKIGATSASTLRCLKKMPPEIFDVVLISLGVNDVTGNRSRKAFIEDQNLILQTLRTKFGASLIVVSGFPPVGKFPSLPQPLRWYLGKQSERFDAALESFVKTQTNCEYLKQKIADDPKLMASDGFHPGAEVYSMWAKEAASVIIRKFD
jgi:lysophospholipase L1-like esterase